MKLAFRVNVDRKLLAVFLFYRPAAIVVASVVLPTPPFSMRSVIVIMTHSVLT